MWHCDTDLLVLISGDCSENSLREAESLYSLPSGYWLSRRQLTTEVLPDHMDTWLVLVHGVQDDLKEEDARLFVVFRFFIQLFMPMSCNAKI